MFHIQRYFYTFPHLNPLNLHNYIINNQINDKVCIHIKYLENKIGHSSRSSSIQRSKTTADKRCLVMLNNFEKFSFPSIEDDMKAGFLDKGRKKGRIF